MTQNLSWRVDSCSSCQEISHFYRTYDVHYHVYKHLPWATKGLRYIHSWTKRNR